MALIKSLIGLKTTTLESGITVSYKSLSHKEWIELPDTDVITDESSQDELRIVMEQLNNRKLQIVKCGLISITPPAEDNEPQPPAILIDDFEPEELPNTLFEEIVQLILDVSVMREDDKKKSDTQLDT